jgi:hypothetical protein
MLDSKDKFGEEERAEIARIKVRSINQHLNEIALLIVEKLDQGLLQMADLSIISQDQNEIIVMGIFKTRS